jgi:hypothetical protein
MTNLERMDLFNSTGVSAEARVFLEFWFDRRRDFVDVFRLPQADLEGWIQEKPELLQGVLWLTARGYFVRHGRDQPWTLSSPFSKLMDENAARAKVAEASARVAEAEKTKQEEVQSAEPPVKLLTEVRLQFNDVSDLELHQTYISLDALAALLVDRIAAKLSS